MLKRKQHRDIFEEPALWSRILVAVILSVVCVLPLAAIASDTRLITVVDGAESVVMMTTENDTERLAKMAGMTLGEYDEVIETDGEGMNATLKIGRAVFAEVTADGETHEVAILDGNVSEALSIAGVELADYDFCNYSVESKVFDGMKITVTRAIHVSVSADGNTKQLILYSGTAADALNKAGVAVNPDDLCNVTPDAVLTDGMSIVVDRVTFQDVTRLEEVPFEEEYVESEVLYQGVEKVYREGTNGERTIITREKYINGGLDSTWVISDAVTKKPVTRVVRVGTKAYPKLGIQQQDSGIAISSGGGPGSVPYSASWHATVNGDGTVIDHEGNAVNYQTMLSGTATAYYTDTVSGTASGRIAQYGVVAVNPKVIPYGTMLYICSPDGSVVYGYAVAGDTGGTLASGSAVVDLYYDNYQQCCWFGCRKMNVYILD